MSKPEISIENRELYPWCVDFERSQRAARNLTTLMGIFRPRVIVGEGLPDQVAEHRAHGGVLALNGPHQNITDQCHVARLPRMAPEVFGELEGVARIGAKVVLFKNPLLRWGIEQMGAFPTIRYKDLKKSLGRDPDEAEVAMLLLNQNEFIDASKAMLENGQDLFNFPQGTRDSNFTKVKEGMGKIAVGVSSDVNLALIPIGIHFPRFRGVGVRNVMRPTIYADQLIRGPFDNAEAVTQMLFTSITDATAEARARTPDLIYQS